MEHLRGLTRLNGLTLDGTQVTDAGLAHLKPLAMLQMLKLDDTRVTDDGFADLQRGRPLLSGGPRGYEERHRAEASSPRGIFDRLVFGRLGRVGVRNRFDRILSRRISLVERICGLTAVQKEELERAGRQDIQETLERIDEQRNALMPNADANVAPDFKRLMRETRPIRRTLSMGPFGNDSLFAGALQTTLMPAQATRYGERAAAARMSKKKIGVNNSRDLEKISDLPIDASLIAFSRDGAQVAFVKSRGPAEVYETGTKRQVRTIGEGK
jgi:hypothetical protein